MNKVSHPYYQYCIWPWVSYRSHSAEQATVAKEDDEEGDREMEDKHIDDE